MPRLTHKLFLRHDEWHSEPGNFTNLRARLLEIVSNKKSNTSYEIDWLMAHADCLVLSCFVLLVVAAKNTLKIKRYWQAQNIAVRLIRQSGLPASP